jgi:hypothetical protein
MAIENPHVDIKVKEYKQGEFEDVHLISPEMFDRPQKGDTGTVERVLNTSAYTKINKVIAYNMIKTRLEMERLETS